MGGLTHRVFVIDFLGVTLSNAYSLNAFRFSQQNYGVTPHRTDKKRKKHTRKSQNAFTNLHY